MEEPGEEAPPGVQAPPPADAVARLRLDDGAAEASSGASSGAGGAGGAPAVASGTAAGATQAGGSSSPPGVPQPPSPLFRVQRPSERDAIAISALLRAGSAGDDGAPGSSSGGGGASSSAAPPGAVVSPPRGGRVTSPTPAEVDAALGGLPALLAAHACASGAGGSSGYSGAGARPGDDDDDDGGGVPDEYGRPPRSRRTPGGAAASAAAAKHADEDDTCASWRARRKHFFIFSAAGKPIYSRYGDETALAGFTASLAALAAFVADRGDALRTVHTATHTLAFLARGPLTLAAVCATGEPETLLRRQLHLLHANVLAILTSGVEKALTKSPKFDARHLLGGTDVAFRSLISRFTWDPSTWLSAVPPLPLPPGARRAAAAPLAAAVSAHGLLAALLLTPERLVASATPKRGALHPDDVLLLANFVRASDSFRTAESFSPVCLPRYNAAAFVYAYVAYLAPAALLVLLTPAPDAFYALADARRAIEASLTRDKVLLAVFSAMQRGPMTLTALPRPAGGGGIGATSLWHFLYVSTPHGQFVFPKFAPPLHTRPAQKRTLRAYAALHAAVHAHPGGGAAPPPASAAAVVAAAAAAAASAVAAAASSAAAATAAGPGAPAGAAASASAAASAANVAASASAAASAAAAGAGAGLPGPAAHRVHFRCSDAHCLLAVIGETFELYAAFDPLTDTPAAVAVANRLCAWLRTQEAELLCL
jgi:hypothetical protein